MTVKLVREIRMTDLSPASQGGSGTSLLMLLHPTEDVRLPFYVELWRALACLVGNVWREVRG